MPCAFVLALPDEPVALGPGVDSLYRGRLLASRLAATCDERSFRQNHCFGLTDCSCALAHPMVAQFSGCHRLETDHSEPFNKALDSLKRVRRFFFATACQCGKRGE